MGIGKRLKRFEVVNFLRYIEFFKSTLQSTDPLHADKKIGHFCFQFLELHINRLFAVNSNEQKKVYLIYFFIYIYI